MFPAVKSISIYKRAPGSFTTAFGLFRKTRSKWYFSIFYRVKT